MFELVNVANVKISSSNVANFQLGIGIGIGNISTMATFTSVGVRSWSWRVEFLETTETSGGVGTRRPTLWWG